MNAHVQNLHSQDLRDQFGRAVSAARHKRRLTQEQAADNASGLVAAGKERIGPGFQQKTQVEVILADGRTPDCAGECKSCTLTHAQNEHI
ncbi:MAG: hypothetical protein ABII82_03790 [Verrucomicrobiota bacterium]